MAEIPLSRGYVALVDDLDSEWLSKYRFGLAIQNAGALPYAVTKVDGHTFGMHRLIMGCSRGDKKLVHHVNGNGLDNRRLNLRIVDRTTHAQHHNVGRPMSSKKRVNITTVTFPADEAEKLKEAINYFGYDGMAVFFKLCGRTLLDHYKRGDLIVAPLTFHTTKTDSHASKKTTR